MSSKGVSNNEKIRVQAFIFGTGILLMALKFAAYLLTGSNAILSDALESIVNIVAGGFGLYSLILAAKPKDEDHPYGHGKIEFVSATIEGSLIIIAGGLIIYKATMAFFNPKPLEQLGFGILLIAISGIVNMLMGILAIRKGKKGSSLTLEASGQHLLSDTYSTGGILLGLLLLYFTGEAWIDSVVAIIMGIVIIINGTRIIKKSMAGIMDEADFQLVEEVVQKLDAVRKPSWIDVHNFRVIKYGEGLHFDCHMTLPWYYTLQEAHDEMKALENVINEAVENSVESFIHTDPCMPFSCEICSMPNCKERQKPQQQRVDWTLANVMFNSKHRLTVE
jgi:cation diffusion facilitator family transporter